MHFIIFTTDYLNKSTISKSAVSLQRGVKLGSVATLQTYKSTGLEIATRNHENHSPAAPNVATK